MNIRCFAPEYSVKKPLTSSDSLSGRSNGMRFDSAMPATKKMRKRERLVEDAPAGQPAPDELALPARHLLEIEACRR